jgi:putative transposase
MVHSQFLTAVVMKPQPGKKDRQDMLHPPVQQNEGRIDIAVAACPTGADMPALIEPLCVNHPTGMTPLRWLELPCGSLSIQAVSFCRFVPQDAEKLCRRTIQNRFVQSRLGHCPVRLILPSGGILLWLRTFGHVGDMQRFRKDGTRYGNKFCRFFMMKVQALPSDLAMQLRHAFIGQPPAPRELLFGIPCPIRVFELLCPMREKTRVLNALQATILCGNRRKGLDAPIKSDRFRSTRPLRLTSEDNRRIPRPMAIQNVTCLWLAHRAGITTDADMANTRQPQPSMLHALTGQQAPPIAVCGIRPALEPLARFEAWISWSLAPAQTPKERLKRPCNTFERVLSGLSGQWRLFLLPERSQITTLIRKAQCGALAFPGSTALLKRGIVQAAVGFPLRLQRGLLRWRGIQAIGCATIDSFHELKYDLVMGTKQQWKILYHYAYNLHFHLIVVTKYRRQCLTPATREHLTGTSAALVDKWGGTLVEGNGEADHMHLLIEPPPTVRLFVFVNNLKTRSSRLLRKVYIQELARWYCKSVLWSRSY